jgi:hypothetical protein
MNRRQVPINYLLQGLINSGLFIQLEPDDPKVVSIKLQSQADITKLRDVIRDSPLDFNALYQVPGEDDTYNRLMSMNIFRNDHGGGWFHVFDSYVGENMSQNIVDLIEGIRVGDEATFRRYADHDHDMLDERIGSANRGLWSLMVDDHIGEAETWFRLSFKKPFKRLPNPHELIDISDDDNPWLQNLLTELYGDQMFPVPTNLDESQLEEEALTSRQAMAQPIPLIDEIEQRAYVHEDDDRAAAAETEEETQYHTAREEWEYDYA